NTLQADTSTSLVGYWSFDDVSGTTAPDSSGNGNNGTLVGSPAPSIAPGKIARAIALTNASDLVSVPDSASLNLTGAFTTSAWVNFNPLPGYGQYPNVVAKLTSPSVYSGFGLFWNSSGVSGIIGPGTSHWYVTAPYRPTAGTWHHYVTTFDGTT